MQLYNICTDETEEVSIRYFARHHLIKLIKYDIPRWCFFSVAIPAKKICKRCVESAVGGIYRRKYLKSVKNWIIKDVAENRLWSIDYYLNKYPELQSWWIKQNGKN